ncbi:MAG: MerR family transcriptional regulator [Thermodesulfobacteriota bacterium]
MNNSIPDKRYFKIGEVSQIVGVEPHVLRYWEAEFKEIRPYRPPSGQRLYRKSDLELVMEIKRLLYEEGFTIAGARKALVQGRGGQLEIGFLDREGDKDRTLLAELKRELLHLQRMFCK